MVAALLAVTLVLSMMTTLTSAVAGRVFHVSSTGTDSADGLSPTTAWRTLSRANRQSLRPGDQLLLQGGARFAGPLRLGADDTGTAAAPVRIGSYGTGRATITADASEGVSVYNTAGVEVGDLTLVGSGGAYRSFSGVSAYSDLPTGRLAYLRISNLEVSGFKDGVAVGGKSGGFQQVVITSVSVHDNRDVGVIFYGPPFNAAAPTYAHADVRLSGVTAYRNVGDPSNLWSNTGSGIVLGSVRGAVVEKSTAFENGSACAAPEGPVGIWTYDSRDVTIQHNVAYRNRSGGVADGGGFDLDQNVSSSVLEYNLSYQNAGPGLMVYTGQANDALADNRVRFNISVDDAGGRGDYGAFTAAGRIANTVVHHNTVIVGALGAARQAAVQLGAGLSGVTFANNVFASLGDGLVVKSVGMAPGHAAFLGNAYYRPAGGMLLAWGNAGYDSLSSWRAAAGQEVTADNVPTGYAGDLGLAGIRTAPSVTTVGQYVPPAGSPLVTAGSGRAVTPDPSTADFLGRPLDTGWWRWAGAARPGG